MEISKELKIKVLVIKKKVKNIIIGSEILNPAINALLKISPSTISFLKFSIIWISKNIIKNIIIFSTNENFTNSINVNTTKINFINKVLSK